MQVYIVSTLAYRVSPKRFFSQKNRVKIPGIDGVTVGEYAKKLDENIANLVRRLKAKQYKPQPGLQVYIPKPNGDKRPLGIPAVEDKIVQMALKDSRIVTTHLYSQME